MASKTAALTPQVAPAQEPEAQVGMELICEEFENGAGVVGKVLGKDKGWVRLELAELGREWLVRDVRIDLASRSWRHVAADYPAVGEKPEFDAEFRAVATPKAPSAAAKAAEELVALAEKLGPDVARIVKSAALPMVGKIDGVPMGSVLARWVGHGKLDAPFISAGTREQKRGAVTGTEGFFSDAVVKKYQQRALRDGVRYFEML